MKRPADDADRKLGNNLAQEARRLALEMRCRKIAETIAPKLQPGTGFALLTFDFGEGGHTAYVSNAARTDIIKLLREMADSLEARS